MNSQTLLKKITIFLVCSLMLSCGMYQKVDQREMPDGAKAKARKNIEEGKGVSIAGIRKGMRKTTYEFSSSNPMWRATLETLDFLPMTTVDYSGGTVITDWYTDESDSTKSIKITVRFLSNEIRSDSLKIIVHQKNCKSVNNCKVNLLEKSQIRNELRSVILKKAALIAKEDKTKKN